MKWKDKIQKIALIIFVSSISFCVLYTGYRAGYNVGEWQGSKDGWESAVFEFKLKTDDATIIKGPVELCAEDLENGRFVIILDCSPYALDLEGNIITISDFNIDFTRY